MLLPNNLSFKLIKLSPQEKKILNLIKSACEYKKPHSLEFYGVLENVSSAIEGYQGRLTKFFWSRYERLVDMQYVLGDPG